MRPASYERISKDERIPHLALNGGRRSKRIPRSHHVNTVNALIGRFGTFLQPFCAEPSCAIGSSTMASASKNLAAYGRWHAARDNADRSVLDALRPLLASGPSSTKNEAKARDPEMSSTKKGTQWYFGMKAHVIAMVRARVEHPFEVLKRQFGYLKTRYRGLARNRAQLLTLFALGSLFLVRRRLPA